MKKTILAPIFLLLALKTAATAATIVIPVSEGSISFVQGNIAYDIYQPTFSLSGPNGSLTGSTPTVDLSLSNTKGPIASGTDTIDPSLHFYTGTAYSGSGGITDFQLLVPGPVHIYNNGAPPFFDEVSGMLTADPFTLTVNASTPVQSFTVSEAFSGELKMTDYTNSWPSPPTLLNQYVFAGRGIAQLNFTDGCNQVGTGCSLMFDSATYTFTPEPSTSALLVLALSFGGAWFVRHRNKHFS